MTSGNTNVIGGIKAAAKGIHGAGETIRGTFNSAIDDLAHDENGKAKNNAVANKGLNEMESMSGAGTGTVSTTGTTTSHAGAIPGASNTGTGAATGYQHTGAPHVGMGGAGSGGTTTYDTTQNPSTSSNNRPHSSKLGNMLDPRVDSNAGQNTTLAGYSSNPNSNVTAGPHSSNVANRVDPRVDSQTGYTNTGGNAGYGNAGATTNTGGNTGYGNASATTNTGFSNNPNSANAGPHSSNLLNKMDPRVDSETGFTNTGPGSNRY
ncbi:MAG: hypothetical protein MMC33_001571 [Icmadophila ericetorum]|nr:hypothetical protein [Icmadophila ericetorum]